jgi:hypothetical protein
MSTWKEKSLEKKILILLKKNKTRLNKLFSNSTSSHFPTHFFKVLFSKGLSKKKTMTIEDLVSKFPKKEGENNFFSLEIESFG